MEDFVNVEYFVNSKNFYFVIFNFESIVHFEYIVNNWFQTDQVLVNEDWLVTATFQAYRS